MKTRDFEVLNTIMKIFADLNIAPGQSSPQRTIWFNAMNNYSLTSADEFNNAVSAAIDSGYLTLLPGGPGGLGSLVLTEAGYTYSRNMD